MKTARACSILLCLLIASCSSAQTTRPIPAIEHVVIISIDGLRPDLALRANTPHLHQLVNDGTFTFWARTTEVSITLPSHVTMLTGVSPKVHGIDFNQDPPKDVEIPHPAKPTLFHLAKKAGYTTAMAAGKSKFSVLITPGDLDWSFIPPTTTTDADGAVQASAMILDHKPQVLFVHFAGVDNAGHSKGWASPEQMAAIEAADAAVGTVQEALKTAKLTDSTFLLITADHGGAGQMHGPDDPRSRHIPWIVSGPGIRKGYDLTRIRSLTVNTEDTFSTACWLLNIPTEAYVEGKAIKQISDAAELLQPSGK